MTEATLKTAYCLGVRDGLPFLLVIGPFALLFGVVAAEAGLNVLQTLSFSMVVIAGAAPFTALRLMVQDMRTLIVIATALAVNLRMAMYSASLAPWLGAAPLWRRALVAYGLVDLSYACAIARFEAIPDWSLPARVGYFASAATPVLPMWYALAVTGALIGAAIPAWLALDFAVPDPACLAAAVGTVAVGLRTRSVLPAMGAGALVLYAGIALSALRG